MSSRPLARSSRPPASARAAAAVGGAVVVNLALLTAGTAAGASFVVPQRGRPGALMDVGVVPVVVSTLLPLILGLLVTAWAVRRRPQAVRGLRALAVAVTLASLAMPLATDTDVTTRALLAAMHLVVGAAYLAAASPAPRAPAPDRRPAPAPAPASR
ncbi:MAG: DUF6069 family protein [Actinomycetota bacterium]|nr:DUF6069 family protein [Actinomycetota bacterium]